MTKDDLIEALEKALMREGADWEDDAGACADAVVEFVAGWLDSRDDGPEGVLSIFAHDDATLWGPVFAQQWLRDMA